MVENGRITEVGKASDVRGPSGATIVDGTGKYLIPGLFDLHTHNSKTRASSLTLFVVNGVTTVRDVGGDREELARWRDKIRAGARVGPRILMAGPYLESADNVARQRGTPMSEMAEPVERTRVPVGSPERARFVVDSVAGLGVDLIKIRTIQNRETYFAIAKAAKQAGLPLAGHTYGITPEDLLAAGHRSIEHVMIPALDDRSAAQRTSLFERFANAGIGVVPTLVTVTRSFNAPDEVVKAFLADSLDRMDSRARYVARFTAIDWREQALEREPGTRAQLEPIYRSNIRNLREMHAAGVRIMPGTDTGVLMIFPGSTLHDELELFVQELGFTPAEALEAGTRQSAEFLGIADSVGTVEPGKVADLVLLEANPLDDIHNTRRIAGVVLGGQFLDRAGLDSLLAAVEVAPDMRVNDWLRAAGR